jgi:hypothetical protein
MRPRTQFAIVLTSGFLVGCVSLPEKVMLDAPKLSPLHAAIELRDAREIASLSSETKTLGLMTTHQFADDQFEPRLMLVLRARLSRELAVELRGKTVVVNGAAVRLTEVSRPPPQGPVYIPPTPGVGVIGGIIAGMMAGGMIAGIERARADRYVYCRIDATIDGEAVSGQGRKDVTPAEAEAGAKIAVNEAIETLIVDIRAKLANPTVDAKEGKAPQ